MCCGEYIRRRVGYLRLLRMSDSLVDAGLQNIIETFETKFPQRIRAYYVEGSYADANSVTTSGLDVLLIFKNRFENDELQKAEDLAKKCESESKLELDIECEDEQRLAHGVSPTLKLGGSFIYGEDIRDTLSLVPIEEWTRDRMHSSLWRAVHLCNRSSIIRYPLPYPDPQAEFYGYDARMLRLSNGQEVHCTRDLIRLVGWSATAMIAFKAGRYVVRKSECHKIYQVCFHDEWGQLLQEIYELCRGKWSYLIPDNLKERQQLRAICERTLGFENHFLQVYKEFILTELHSKDIQGLHHILFVLRNIVYYDEEIKTVIYLLQEDKREEIRVVARGMLKLLEIY